MNSPMLQNAIGVPKGFKRTNCATEFALGRAIQIRVNSECGSSELREGMLVFMSRFRHRKRRGRRTHHDIHFAHR